MGRVADLEFSADEIANGSRAACWMRLRPGRSPAKRSTGRVPICGTSRPNIDGAVVGFEGLRPLLKRKESGSR